LNPTLEQTPTPGSENPKYVLLWAHEDTISLLSSILTPTDHWMPLAPTSTLILEFDPNESNELLV